MFFKKDEKKKLEKEWLELREETRASAKPAIEDLMVELVGHMQISAKTDLWSKEEFEDMMKEMVCEADKLFREMSPGEILDEMTKRKMKKLNAKVIEVRI